MCIPPSRLVCAAQYGKLIETDEDVRRAMRPPTYYDDFEWRDPASRSPFTRLVRLSSDADRVGIETPPECHREGCRKGGPVKAY